MIRILALLAFIVAPHVVMAETFSSSPVTLDNIPGGPLGVANGGTASSNGISAIDTLASLSSTATGVLARLYSRSAYYYGVVTQSCVDPSDPPYNADSTGATDVTDIFTEIHEDGKAICFKKDNEVFAIKNYSPPNGSVIRGNDTPGYNTPTSHKIIPASGATSVFKMLRTDSSMVVGLNLSGFSIYNNGSSGVAAFTGGGYAVKLIDMWVGGGFENGLGDNAVTYTQGAQLYNTVFYGNSVNIRNIVDSTAVGGSVSGAYYQNVMLQNGSNSNYLAWSHNEWAGSCPNNSEHTGSCTGTTSPGITVWNSSYNTIVVGLHDANAGPGVLFKKDTGSSYLTEGNTIIGGVFRRNGRGEQDDSDSHITLVGNVTNTVIGAITTAYGEDDYSGGAVTPLYGVDFVCNTSGCPTTTVINGSNLTGVTGTGSAPVQNLSSAVDTIILASPTVDTYIGTIAQGTWNGDVVGVSYGGTGTSTQFTSGSILFAGTSGVYSQNNSSLFWDNTNSYLGIGTAIPSSAINIVTANSAIHPELVIRNSANSRSATFGLSDGWNTFIKNTGGAWIEFQTSSSTQMVIDASGNVGIGLSSTPTAKLSVNGNYATRSGGRAVHTGTSSGTLVSGIASTYEGANTESGAFTVTLAAPIGDGERRRVCFANTTGTITWTPTSPATSVTGAPTTVSAGNCVELVYNSVSDTPTNAAAKTWYVY